MLELRIHGRGGQGVVTAAELLSLAAFIEGFHAQAFPSFGSERTGAPVVSFCRIDHHPIRTHEPIANPAAVLIIDPTLLHQVDVFTGLLPDGDVLINSSRSPQQLRLAPLLETQGAEHVQIVPATAIAREHLGRPLPNAAMLGAFAAHTQALALGSLLEAISQRFDAGAAAGNVAAAAHAYALVAPQRATPELLLGTGADG